MAKYGISGVIGGGSAEGGAVERHMIGLQQAHARRGVELETGRAPRARLPVPSRAEPRAAMREAALHNEENMKMFGELRLRASLDSSAPPRMTRRHSRQL
jgi:hypothetical protein